MSEEDVLIGGDVINAILKLMSRGSRLRIQLKNSPRQIFGINVETGQIEGEANKSDKNGNHKTAALLTCKKVFFKAVSQQEGIANAEVGHQLIEIGLLVAGALAQDSGVRLVKQALLIQDSESRRFFGDVF